MNSAALLEHPIAAGDLHMTFFYAGAARCTGGHGTEP